MSDAAQRLPWWVRLRCYFAKVDPPANETAAWPSAWTVQPERIDEAIRVVTDGRFSDLDDALAQLAYWEELNREDAE